MCGVCVRVCVCVCVVCVCVSVSVCVCCVCVCVVCGVCVCDIVEAHCYFVDIGRTDCEQIRSRINNNDCRMFRPRRPLSTAYKTQLTKAFVAETSCNHCS